AAPPPEGEQGRRQRRVVAEATLPDPSDLAGMESVVVGAAGDKAGAACQQRRCKGQDDAVPPGRRDPLARQSTRASHGQQEAAAEDGCIAVKEKGTVSPQDWNHPLHHSRRWVAGQKEV